ncbi:MAG TPA: cobalt ECF transporter T component CbiQ [Candidatus Methanoperedens sp.]
MTDTRIKLPVSFFLIIALTMAKHWYLPFIISVLAFLISMKLNMLRDYTRKLFFPLVMSMFILVIQGLNYGVNPVRIGFIQVYAEGLDYGILIFSRVIASASILILLVQTTSDKELLESMHWFRVPRTILEISSFMMRYINTFSSEGKKMKSAMDSRSGFAKKLGFPDKARNAAMICAALFIRAFMKSEDVYRAMISRAWGPQVQYINDTAPLNKKDMFLGAALLFGILIITAVDFSI